MMPETYERINYSLRPAKSVERKMLRDTFRRLIYLAPIESYRYIGFGSTYFSDFTLFHKTLGINQMISIERDIQNKDRFEFNRPFRCIKIEWGDSSDILSLLTWNTKTILWLDYDSRLSGTVLQDIAFYCANCAPASILIITVNAEPDRLDPREIESAGLSYDEQNFNYRVEKLVSEVGESRVPLNVSGKELGKWGKARIYRTIITNEILQSLNNRNGGFSNEKQFLFKQLFNFHYADGAKMLTVGGILHENSQAEVLAKCEFEDLPFVKMNADPFFIDTPKLTYREIRHLDRKLPLEGTKKLGRSLGIPFDQLEMYSKLYRYFPNFVEAEL